MMGHYDAAPKLPLWKIAQQLHARRQFLHGRVRRLVPQPLLADLRLHADLSRMPTQPGEGRDRRGRSRRRHAEARATIRRNRRSTAFRSSSTTATSRRTSTPSTRCSRPISRAPTSRRRAAIRRSPIPSAPTTLPPQTLTDHRRSAQPPRASSWAWYAGAWQAALDGKNAHAGAELPVPPPAVQLLRRHARRAQPARAEHLQGRRHRTASSSSRRSTPARCRRSTFYKPQGNLNEHAGYADVDVRRPAHRRRDRAPAEEPAVGAHAGRRHLRRERRLLGSRRAAQGRPLGPGHAHPGDHRLAVRQAAATSITRSTTRPRSCASSRGASICRCCRA